MASLRIRGQAANAPLIPGEQFGLGGASGLRGLQEREGTGESGHLASVELLTPAFLLEGLRGVLFVDAGEVRPQAAGQGRQHAAGTGFGVRYHWRQNLSLSADWARLTDGIDTAQRGQSRLHATLSYRF